MADDLLNRFADNARKEIGEQEATKKKEPNKTVAIRISDYERLRQYAFDNHKKMVDVIHEVLNLGFDELEK